MLKVFKSIVYFVICKLLFRIEYINLDKKKQLEGRNVICANHNDWIDAVIMWTKTEKPKIMAKAELFKVPVWSHILKACGVFPINRGQKDFKSIYHAVKVVEEKNNLVIFPEGTRKAKKKNVKAKIGAVYVAIAADADIIPVYIEEGKRYPFKKIRVVHGTPYSLSEYKEQIKDKKLLNELTTELMDKIYSLGDKIDAK